MNSIITVDSYIKPYVGLRPFESSESELFFGREEQIQKLLIKLGRANFVAVVGSSGSGKSSLVRAGLIPALKAGFLNQGDYWHVAWFKPTDNPLYYFARSLTEAFDLNMSPVELEKAIQQEGVTEVIDRVAPFLHDNESSLLIFIDQFEELFTHFKNISEQSALMYRFEFVKIILGLIHSDLPIYVILTMRSDFIAKCNTFHGLAEELSNSQFLVPRLHASELHRVIEGPIKLFGGTLEHGLTQKILNDLEEGDDQLPILEHTLSQLWRVRKSDSIVTLEDYEATGKLKQALSLHANAIYASLIEKQSNLEMITKELFKFIIDFDGEKREGVRQPRKVHEIQQVTGATFEEIKTVYDAFSVDHACFLCSPSRRPLDEFSLVDISHESLMREWDLFKKWKEEEEKDKRYVERLHDFATEFHDRKRGTLRGPELAIYSKWTKYVAFKDNAKRQQVLYWAKRYNINFEKVKNYIQISRRKAIIIQFGWWALIGLVLASAVGFWMLIKQRELNEAESAAESRELREVVRARTDSTNLFLLKLQRMKAAESETEKALVESHLKFIQSQLEIVRLQELIKRNEEIIKELAAKSGNESSTLASHNESLNRALSETQTKYSRAVSMIDSLNTVISRYEKQANLNGSSTTELAAFDSKAKIKATRLVPLGRGSYDVCLTIEASPEEMGKIDKVRYYAPNVNPVEESKQAVKFKHCFQIKATLIQVVIAFKDKSLKRIDYDLGKASQ